MSSTISVKPFWYERFRNAIFVCLIVSLVWTVLIVLPFRPFSYLPPIIAGGGPGTWFVLAYLLFLILGLCGFGTIYGLLHTIETQENRSISPSIMWIAFILLSIGIASSCALLAIGGAIGGYASTIQGMSGTTLQNDLSPYVDPITLAILMAVAGAALTILSMLRAK